MKLATCILDPLADRRWDQFVSRHPSGLIYHTAAWSKVIQATFGHKPLYIVLESPGDDRIAAGMPFFIVNSRLTGQRVVSLPFSTFCNPLASTREMIQILEFAARQVPGAGHIKLKLLDVDAAVLPGARISSEYVTHFIDLRQDLDQMFESFHGSSVRQRIKRAERSGLTFRMGESLADMITFYRLLKGVRRRHGLPPHPRSFFENMWSILEPAGLLELPMVEHEGQVVAGSIVLRWGTMVHHEYSASTEASWKLCSNQKLLWEIIKHAHAQKAHYLDLGRSEINNPSLIDYKERWQGQRRLLSYCTLPVAARAKPATGKNNGKSRLKKTLEYINHHLPDLLLELEGRLIYPHID